MDASDLKGAFGFSMGSGSEDPKITRIARGSAGYRDAEIPGESSFTVRRPLSGWDVAVFSRRNARRGEGLDAFDDAAPPVFAARKLSRCAGQQAQRELARGWRAALRLEFDEVFAIAAALELTMTSLPSPAMGRLRGEIQLLRAVGLALGDDSGAARMLALSAKKTRLCPLLRRLASTVCRFDL